jgi:hypothetical protein
VVHEQQ